MFKRRNKRTTWQAVAEFFYPRKGWTRAINYLSYRIKRLPDTPHNIALGFSAGVFVCFTPLFGLHFFLAAFIALVLRGNVLASLIGTFVGNPLTFPIIAASSYNLGRFMLGNGRVESAWQNIKSSFAEAWHDIWANLAELFGGPEADWSGFHQFFFDVFLPYLVGGFLPGLITAGIFYFVTRPVVAAYQKRRRGRLMAKLKELRNNRKSTAENNG